MFYRLAIRVTGRYQRCDVEAKAAQRVVDERHEQLDVAQRVARLAQLELFLSANNRTELRIQTHNFHVNTKHQKRRSVERSVARPQRESNTKTCKTTRSLATALPQSACRCIAGKNGTAAAGRSAANAPPKTGRQYAIRCCCRCCRSIVDCQRCLLLLLNRMSVSEKCILVCL
jgi:hypothetical protein